MQNIHKNRLKFFVALLTVTTMLSGIFSAVPALGAGTETIQLDGATTATISEGTTAFLVLKATDSAGDPVSLTGDIMFSVSSFSPPSTSPDIILDHPAVDNVGGVIHFSGSSMTIPVKAVDDEDNSEGLEVYSIYLTSFQGGRPNQQLGSNNLFTVAVTDNTGLPYLNFATIPGARNLESASQQLAISLSRAVPQDVTFDIEVDSANTTAQNTETTLGGNTLPADFTLANSVPVTIPANQLTATVDLGIQEDSIYEGSEQIAVRIANPVNAQVGVSSYTYTILDTEEMPAIEFSSTADTGDESVSSKTVLVALSAISAVDVEFTILAAGGTATAGDLTADASDWNASFGVLMMIPAGTLSVPVELTIKDDSQIEADETAIAELSHVSGAEVGVNSTFTYTIVNNDSNSAAGSYGTAIPQSTASVGGVAAGSVVVTPAPVVPAPTPTTPAPVVPAPVQENTGGQVLGVQTSLVHELIAKLKFGSTSDEVNQLQVELQKLGFFPAKAKTTRYYGVVTRAAVQKYLDTKVSELSLHDLATMLKFGQRGVAVKKLQNELKTAGFFPANTAATGFYGNLTKQAVASHMAR